MSYSQSCVKLLHCNGLAPSPHGGASMHRQPRSETSNYRVNVLSGWTQSVVLSRPDLPLDVCLQLQYCTKKKQKTNPFIFVYSENAGHARLGRLALGVDNSSFQAIELCASVVCRRQFKESIWKPSCLVAATSSEPGCLRRELSAVQKMCETVFCNPQERKGGDGFHTNEYVLVSTGVRSSYIRVNMNTRRQGRKLSHSCQDLLWLVLSTLFG
jgi:hypothetical protein